MKRILAGALLVALAACGDGPTQVPLDRQLTFDRQLALTGGEEATWTFTSDVLDVFGDFPGTTGAALAGRIAFTITSPDLAGDPCFVYHTADVSFTYTVDGTTREAAGAGVAISYLECHWVDGPIVQIDFFDEATGRQWYLQLRTVQEYAEFPLTVPEISYEWPRSSFNVIDYDPAFQVEGRLLSWLTSLGLADPTTKEACMAGGWQDFGFRNQGQCIRFVNTGKDSR